MTDISLKELVAAALSLAIVGFTIYLMNSIFVGGKPPDAAQMAILQSITGLAGTATGYYFGRIPAEKSAKIAQDTVATAQGIIANSAASAAASGAEAAKTASDNQRIINQINALRGDLGTPTGGAKTDISGNDSVEEIRRRLTNIVENSR